MDAQSFLRGQWIQFIAIGRLRNWQEDSVTQKPILEDKQPHLPMLMALQSQRLLKV